MLSNGTVLQQRYQIAQHIGGGGMGDVYLANDLRLGNPVVVKENRGGDPQLFYSEARILSALRHPNLPRVSDHFVEQNQLQYLVMDYIAGQNLEQIVQARGALREQDARVWLDQIFDAVKYLHANRIIHRDIKPQNIIVTQQGVAMLVDFGIAKMMASGGPTVSAAHGIGSPGYAPLEQYYGGTDERSDIYALGATLYFALAGIAPPSAPERANGVPWQPLRALNPSVSANTEQTIATAAAVVKTQRYQTIDQFQNVLRAPVPVSTPVQPPSAPWVTPTVPVAPHTPTWVWLASGAGALLFAGVVLFGVIALSSRPAPTPAPAPAPTRVAEATRTIAPPTRAPIVAPTDVLPTPLVIVVTATPIPTFTPTATPLFTPTPRAGDTRNFAPDNAPMMFVSAGEFTMGSNDNDNEKPPHTVYLDAFWMDKFEATNALYKKCVDAGKCAAPSQTKSYTRDAYFGNTQYDNYPVSYVDWNQAKTYCEWAGKRLPTEAEWEKAARGTDGRVYPWGNQWDGTRVNFCDKNCPFDWRDNNADDGYADTSPVGNYARGASPYGIMDLAGNVWEWVADWYGENYYASSPRNNPRGPSSGQFRVQRGGAWSYVP